MVEKSKKVEEERHPRKKEGNQSKKKGQKAKENTLIFRFMDAMVAI